MPEQTDQSKSVLVISYGPVPTPEYQTVEGGGMRAWGLAKGLLDNNVGVTVAINGSFPQNLHEHEGVKLTNWNLDDGFANLINSVDSVIVSYNAGDLSVFVVNNIRDDVQLILDAYVPIYIEVSARKAADMPQEYKNYFEDFKRHNFVLKRGDYFLCASETQKFFYTGALSSLGIINPYTYGDHRLLVVPFGIHNIPAKAQNNPYKKLGIDSKKHKTVLWFGGLYPWFRIDEFLATVQTLSQIDETYKFVIVGGKNPFNPNPDLARQYDHTVEFARKNKLIDRHLFFVDWVDFDTRINWYKHADFIISINQPGEENIFSWRTRVMDYVWGETVTLTNGGDPLSEDLLKAGAAIKLNGLSSDSMIKSIQQIYKDPSVLKNVGQALIDLKPTYYWENVTRILPPLMTPENLHYKKEKAFQNEIGFDFGEPSIEQTTAEANTYFAKARKAIKLAPRVASYAKRKGLKQSARLAVTTIKNQTKKRSLPALKQYIFLSNPLDNSGAPLVLTQIVQDLVKAHPRIRRHARVIAPFAVKNRQKEYRDMGVKLEKAVHGLNAPLTGLQLSVKRNDFVLLNTAAVFDNYRHYIFNLLDAGRLKHAYWFIHEDIAQLSVVAPQIAKKEIASKVHKLVESGRLTIMVPSKRVKQDYDSLFNTNKVKSIDLRIDVDDKYIQPKAADDYKKINFLLSGNSSDGRKGHLIALAAFQRFLLKYHAQNPSYYRDFSLNFVAVFDDYVSQQVKSIGQAILGKRLHIHPSLPRDEALRITADCNAVICCSLNETFALYVAEGMAMGHIVLRNDSAGIDEQLEDGKNGFYIDSNDVNQFADVIEKVLNKKLSDEKLQKMGARSESMAAKFLDQDYSRVIDINR